MHNLKLFFNNELKNLHCDINTKSYILNVLTEYNKNYNYSNESLTLIYINAKNTQDFATFQSLADWLFLCYSAFPENLQDASKEYYYSIARLSYYSCFKLINRKWILFENLADDFEYLTSSTNRIFKTI